LSALIIGLFLFSFSDPIFFIFAPFAGLVSFYLLLGFFIGSASKDFNWVKHHQHVITYLNARPSIDIFYCVCGENITVVRRALASICELAEYYGRNCTVNILDDSKDGAHKSDAFWAAENFKCRVKYLRRDNPGQDKKSGNLRYAFSKTSGEFIAIFDADFCPDYNFFNHTVPWMLHDETIAIVQTPQYFELDDHRTWVGKGAAYVQELFYRLIQVSRCHFNAAICVGTNALYRRTALEPHGGTALIPYSEDVRTGFRCTVDGWKLKYIPACLAKGICPDTMPAFFLQQHRWALGSISLFFSKEFWVNNLTLMQRLCYLSGMFYYITTGIMLIAGFIPSLALLFFKPEAMFFWSLIYTVPSFVFGTVVMAIWSINRWGWYVPMSRILSYHAHLFALIEYLTKSVTPWQSTGVAVKTKVYERAMKLLKYSCFVSVFIIILCIYRGMEYGFLNMVPCMFFTCFDLYVKARIVAQQI
jgi:cellulose synthase/poly-beta-1,6-N-acetylglucosamine synthase-like glycosyltransferase